MCARLQPYLRNISVVSRISAVFFTYRDNSAKPNISRIFFQPSVISKKIMLGGLSVDRFLRKIRQMTVLPAVYRCMHSQFADHLTLTSLPSFVFVLRTTTTTSRTSLSTRHVGLSTVHCWSDGLELAIRRAVQTVLSSSLRQSCSVSTNIIEKKL